MNDQPKQHSDSNWLVLLVIGGLIILGLAGFLFYKKQASQSSQVLEAAKKEEPKKVVIQPAQPMVTAPAAKPIPVEKTDTETPEPTATDAGTRPAKNKGTHVSKMGTIDPNVLQKFVNSKFASVKACYEQRLKTNPMLEGTINLRISVSRSGNVQGVTVNSDSVRDQQMLNCVTQTVRRWVFPKPTGGHIVFDKPFKFKKKS